jgi:AraC family transcriptional regulator of adaptative response/methylated-DNA-[protein]-cysteine methyltransferase
MRCFHSSKERYMVMQRKNGATRRITQSLMESRKDVERWVALTARSSQADGSFLYGVRTTGVFGRPSCPSRKPRKDNVEFFDTAKEALRAGYRACKRCRPTEDVRPGRGLEAVSEACAMLAREEMVHTRDIARAIGLSESYFQRCFKKHLGVTPQQYRRRVVAERARDTIGKSRSVTESIYEAGYSSSSRFYAGAARELGMKPSDANRGGVGQSIRYVIAECSLGQAVIAWTARGVCEVAFADSAEALQHRLQSHFPNAKLERVAHHEWAQAIIQSVEMTTHADVPIDIAGTAFQERVWRALRSIPLGETRTYAEIAETLGEPSAARAVARACSKNLLAVVIPCHRVVRKDGKLAGYRWGIERKRELLRRERR